MLDEVPVVQDLVLSVIEYCHHFRMYYSSYTFPDDYYTLSRYVRVWLEVSTDAEWEHLIDRVCLYFCLY